MSGTKRQTLHDMQAILACRRRKHRLTLLYKMKHGLTPRYLTHMIPNQSQDRYPLRNAESIRLLKVKTQQYASSFLPAIIRDSHQKHNKPIQCIFLNQNYKHILVGLLFYIMLAPVEIKYYIVVFDLIAVPLIMIN